MTIHVLWIGPVLVGLLVLWVRLHELHLIRKQEQRVAQKICQNCADLLRILNQYESARNDTDLLRLAEEIADDADKASNYQWYSAHKAELQNNSRLLRAVLKPLPPTSTLRH